MTVNVTGATDTQKTLLTEAAEFFATQLMDARMVRNLEIDIELHGRKTDAHGYCVNEDGNRKSRWFTIELRRQNIDEMIKSLAHEMVHVKQYAKNELQSIWPSYPSRRRGGYKIQNKWLGVPWKPKRKECPYYDAPWEQEAYAKEVSLVYKWATRHEKTMPWCVAAA